MISMRYYVFLMLLTQATENVITQSIKQCGSLTCLHNALCADGGQSCQCRRGYIGDTCQNDLNECEFETDPCFHRGKCENTFGSWRCQCLQGWKNGGLTHCEIRTNPDIHHRKCMSGWVGEWCFDQCLNDTMCGPNAVCKKHGRGRLCFCNDGWDKVDCVTDKDECKENPCRGLKACVNTTRSFTCMCPTGRQGPSCADDIDECLGNPCSNSGTCTNTDGSYFCHCTDGWEGINCDEDIDEFDVGGADLKVILVASLGALLLLFLLIFLLITIRNKCKEKHDKHRGRTAVLPEKQAFPQREFGAPTAIRQGFVYQQDKPVLRKDGLDF